MALFTVVPKSERAYAAPIVPLYLFYAIAHIVPMTVGFLNWVTLQAWGRRIYRDHYESDAKLRAAANASRTCSEESCMTVRGTPAPALYRPAMYWEHRAQQFAAEGAGSPPFVRTACPSSTTG